MTLRWEYLSVQWEQKAKQVAADKWEFTSDITIIDAHGGVEERQGLPGPGQLDNVYCEFGRDGWELVSETVAASGLVPLGPWPTASQALRYRGVMKRPLP